MPLFCALVFLHIVISSGFSDCLIKSVGILFLSCMLSFHSFFSFFLPTVVPLSAHSSCFSFTFSFLWPSPFFSDRYYSAGFNTWAMCERTKFVCDRRALWRDLPVLLSSRSSRQTCAKLRAWCQDFVRLIFLFFYADRRRYSCARRLTLPCFSEKISAERRDVLFSYFRRRNLHWWREAAILKKVCLRSCGFQYVQACAS